MLLFPHISNRLTGSCLCAAVVYQPGKPSRTVTMKKPCTRTTGNMKKKEVLYLCPHTHAGHSNMPTGLLSPHAHTRLHTHERKLSPARKGRP